MSKVDLGRFTYDYIVARKEALVSAAGSRNDVMDRMEGYYSFKFWKDKRKDGEQRLTTPIAFDVVEKNRAMLMARPPTVSVPPANVEDPADVERAQRKEKFLYGLMYQANVYQALSRADWYANCLGRGYVKAVVDQYAGENDAPVVVTAPDPRGIYGRLSASRDRWVELVHTWERPRKEIEEEWDFRFPRQAGMTAEDEAAWLDEAVPYIEYWTLVATFEERKKEDGKRKKDEIGGVMAGQMAGETAEADAERVEALKRRVWKVVHSVVVEDGDGVVVKKPMVMVGYQWIPYFSWAGIDAPLSDGDSRDGMSVLYPLTGGEDPANSGGVVQGLNLLMSLILDETVRNVRAAFITDDQESVLSLEPDVINRVKPGSRWQYLQAPGVSGQAVQVFEYIKQFSDRLGIPAPLTGEKMMQLSGQAISAFASAFELWIAERQRERERAISQMLTHVLRLARTYADPVTGWATYGVDTSGKTLRASVTPDDLHANDWAQVKLSAAMPKDVVGMVMMLFNLWKGDAISHEWFLDEVSQYLQRGAVNPQEEMRKIQAEKAPPSAPPGTMPGTMPGAMPGAMPGGEAGAGPMPGPGMGMGPAAVAATPAMVGAAGNLEGMAAMLGQR